MTHAVAETYDCRVKNCGEKFPNAEDLKQHIETHTFEKICCGKKFVEAEEYKNHKQEHSNQFKCDECGDVLGTLQLYAKHMRIHAGEKLYQQFKESQKRSETSTESVSYLTEAIDF